MKQPLQTLPLPSSSLWSIRDLRIVIPARTLSIVGDTVALIALTLRIHDQGAGTHGIAQLMVAFALPTVLAMGVAGDISDRFDSRRVLVAAGALQATACAGLALVEDRWATYGLVVVLQLGQAVSNPTWSALLPRIAGDERMGRVMGLQQSLTAAAGIAGAAVAGLLVGTRGSGGALWVDCATFVVLIAAAGAVRTRRGGGPVSASPVVASPVVASPVVASPVVASPVVASPKASPRPGMFDGLRIMRRDRLVWLVFTWTVPFIIVLEGVNVLEVFLARDSLGATPTMYGALEAFFGAGAIVGGWLAGRVASTDAQRVTLLLAGLSGAAACIVAAGAAPTVAVLAAVLVVLGVANSTANACLGPLFVVRAAEADRGKVIAASQGVARTASVIALALGGLLGGVLGPRTSFMAGGALGLLVIVGLVVALRGVDREPPARVPAPELASVG